ncbi:hypothetical protein HWV62_8056 [Athelia sp. TMB]|nr:hypothetical protein HWV62_8056 [Athelia sp. TMB]
MMSDWSYNYQPDNTLPDSPLESPSPQSDLLSQHFGSDNQFVGALQRSRQSSFTTPKGPGEKFRKEREQVHSGVSRAELLRALIHEEYECRQTRKIMYKAYDQYQSESRRATEAEGRAIEAAKKYRVLNETRILAQNEAARLKEELRLYKVQLEQAQAEILKAQNVVRVVEEQRDDAEAAAARSRDTARKLHEQMMIEQAREEGRKMGFEEGVKRGRETVIVEKDDVVRDSGYEGSRANDSRTMAERTLDRLLGDEDGTHRSATPSGSSTPRDFRASSPAQKDRPSVRSRRTSSSGPTAGPSRLRQEISVPEPMPLSRPILESPMSSPQPHSGVVLPPDGWIPTADGDGIALPPPHELQRPFSDNSSITSGRPGSEASARDYFSGDAPRRPHRNSVGSQGSTAYSKASTAISQMDLVSAPPADTPSARPNAARRDLSVIGEEASQQGTPSGSFRMHSVNDTYDSQVPFPPLRAPNFAAAIGRTSSESDMDSPAQLREARLRDQRMMNQKMADNLRYSDPKEVEQWRRSGAEGSSQSNRAPSHRPAKVTVPSPLSPRGLGRDSIIESPGMHRRALSMTSASSQSLNVPGSRPRPGRGSSNGSSIEITIQPPSRPSSDHTDIPIGGAAHLLSPDHANRELPPVVPRPSSRGPVREEVPTQPNTPEPEHIFRHLPDGNFPLGFTPNQPSNIRSLPGDEINSPIALPVPPPFGPASGYSNRSYIPSPLGRPADLLSPNMNLAGLPSEPPRPPSTTKTSKSSRRSKTPVSIYAPASPAPPTNFPGSHYSTVPPGNVGQPVIPSNSRVGGHRRSISMSSALSPSSLGIPQQLPGGAVSPRTSNLPLGGGYAHYDPSRDANPGYFVGNDYDQDPATAANTYANANGLRPPGSPHGPYTRPPPLSP